MSPKRPPPQRLHTPLTTTHTGESSERAEGEASKRAEDESSESGEESSG